MVNNFIHMFNQKLFNFISIIFYVYVYCLRNGHLNVTYWTQCMLIIYTIVKHMHTSNALFLLGIGSNFTRIRFQFHFQFKFDFIRVWVACVSVEDMRSTRKSQ